MDYKKVILGIIYSIWVVVAVFQQIVWIKHGTYGVLAILWFLIFVGTPYLFYRNWDK